MDSIISLLDSWETRFERLLPPTQRQGSKCARLNHFKLQEECAYCHRLVWGKNTANDPDRMDWVPSEQPVVMYCKDFPRGTWELLWHETYDIGAPILPDGSICWCVETSLHPPLGYLVLHQGCFAAINGTDVSAERMDRLGRVLACMDSESIGFVKTKYLRAMPEVTDFRHDSMSQVGHRLGLPLGYLPLETLRHIQSYCQDAPFWEWVKALDFRYSLNVMPRTEMLSVGLGQVIQWTRGTDSPVISSSNASSGPVRITFDKRGLYRIEQLSSLRICLAKHPFRRFIILELGRCKSIKAYFKDGICCLGSWTSWSSVTTVWDIPSPPMIHASEWSEDYDGSYPGHLDPESCSMLPARYSRSVGTINLDDVAGLVFTHSTWTISVTPYHKPLPLRHQNDWDSSKDSVYMPLASNDRILWMQVRYDSQSDLYSVPVKTELSGVIHLGKQARRPTETRAFSEAPRAIFCNGRGDDLERPTCTPYTSQVVAIYPKGNLTPDHEVSKLSRIGPPIPALTFPRQTERIAWSWAPLENIACVRVFHTPFVYSFMGAHITYKNGGQRFVGDFHRISSANEVRVENPTRMYVEGKIYQSQPLGLPDISNSQRVWFIGKDVEGFKGAELMPIFDLAGELHFWHSFRTYFYASEVQVLPSGSWRGTLG